MAEFVTVMRERERMCKATRKAQGCSECELSSFKKGVGRTCYAYTADFPEEAEKIIMDWAAEHPVETMKDRFFKMFPNAPKLKDGNPISCPRHLGWAESCAKNRGIAHCIDCWNRPYEERSVKNE